MDRARWLIIKPSLETALDLDTDARRVWLSELSVASPDIAQEVAQLLATESTEAGDLLDEPLLIQPPDPGASWAGQCVGAYRLEREIGRGGMGSVWLAYAGDDGEQPVAFKLLNRALLGRGGRERFAREGRMLSRLRHPNIARFIDAGVTEDGHPFLVLEYIVGRRIDQFADEARCTPRQRIALVLDVLAAVAHAHANLIVHRDIKPSNILVADDGRPMLLDFGIAKLLSEGRDVADPSSLSNEGGLPLTPRYAAPEQIRGQPVSTATDVYSLGVLLYVLLSGRHPTNDGCATPADEVRAVLQTMPRRLSDHGALAGILAKALEKVPAERYRTVTDLSADLTRFLNHEPSNGRLDSWATRL